MPFGETALDGRVWFALVGLGGLVGMDASSWPQAMISRPLVAGTLGGAMVGDAGQGFVVGSILELFSLRHPPFGAARYPDTGPAALVAGCAAALAPSRPAGVMLAVLVGWGLGWIGLQTVVWLRRRNDSLMMDGRRRSARRLEVRQLVGIGWDFVRAAVLTGVFLVPAVLAVQLGANLGPGSPGVGARLALVLAIGAAVGAGGRLLSARLRDWPFLATGAVAALLIAVLR